MSGEPRWSEHGQTLVGIAAIIFSGFLPLYFGIRASIVLDFGVYFFVLSDLIAFKHASAVDILVQ